MGLLAIELCKMALHIDRVLEMCGLICVSRADDLRVENVVSITITFVFPHYPYFPDWRFRFIIDPFYLRFMSLISIE